MSSTSVASVVRNIRVTVGSSAASADTKCTSRASMLLGKAVTRAARPALGLWLVGLVGDEDPIAERRVLGDDLEPVGERGERREPRHVEHEDEQVDAAEVRTNNRPEALLPGRVPQMKRNVQPPDALGPRHKVDANGRLVRELVVDVALKERGFADGVVADKGGLDEEVGAGVVHVLEGESM